MTMPKVHTSQTQRNLLAYGLMGSAGVIFLLIAYFVTTKDGFFYFFFKEIGFALVVAVCLVGTIERFTRERHEAAAEATMAEINKNLFYAVFKRYIPEKVFEEVEKSVMEADVVRSKHELNYTIEEVEDGQVQCLAQTSYELTSVVDAPILHKVVVRLELPVDDQRKNDCYVEKIVVGSNVYDRTKLGPHVKQTREHYSVEFPIEIAGRATVRISTHSKLVKQSTDVEVWASRIPSDGLELTVSTPSKELVVCASANHSAQLTTVIDNDVTKKWALQHGIFPYQSIMFWWKPKARPAKAT